MRHILLLLCVLLSGYAKESSAASHEIIRGESFLNYYVTVNGASTNGSFTDYTMDINFAPSVPEESYVTGEVRLSRKTITALYDEVAKGIVTSDWLDVDKYPKATFNFKNFELSTPNNYKGHGTLTLLGKTLPIECSLILNTRQDGTVVADATVLVDRIEYGIGRGEWEETSTIHNIVTVHAHLITRPTASKTPPKQY